MSSVQRQVQERKLADKTFANKASLCFAIWSQAIPVCMRFCFAADLSCFPVIRNVFCDAVVTAAWMAVEASGI